MVATARIAGEHGPFNHIRQVASTCTRIWIIGPTRVVPLNRLSIGSAILQGSRVNLPPV